MAAFHFRHHNADAISLPWRAAMRDLSPFGPAVAAAASAAVATVSVCRGIASAPACSSVTAGCSLLTGNATILPPTSNSPRYFKLPRRLSLSYGPAINGCNDPFISQCTSRPTAYATCQCSCRCLCMNSMHFNDIKERVYGIHRKVTGGCTQWDQIVVACLSLCSKTVRSRTRTCDAAASVQQLLLRPPGQVQERRFSSSDPLSINRIKFIPYPVNTSIFFRTCCSVLAQSESPRTSLPQGKKYEEESCNVLGHEAPCHVPMACSSFSSSNRGVDINSTTSSHHTTNSSDAPRLDSSILGNTDSGVIDKVESSRTPGRIDEEESFEGRSTRKTVVCSSPLEVQANDGSRSIHTSRSVSSQAPQPNADEVGQTAAISSKLTECGNSTSRRQWDVHAAALRRALQLAEFVSLDIELTGLHVRNEKFIGVDRCYEAHCEGARAFMPIQLGLCAARRAGPRHPHRWILTPASIYVFPVESRIFQASTATMSFLRESGLDFNEWIAHGVPYMRAQEEREKRQALEARIVELEQLKFRAAEENSNAASLAEREVPPQVFPYALATVEDKQLADTVRAAIQSWLASGSKQPLHLPVDNPLQRLLLHSLVASEFPHISSHSAKSGDQRVLAIYRSEGEVYEEQLRALKEEVIKLKQLRGVRQLLDDIADRRLVVVGHNCFYDLLHLYQTLYGDLPESVAAFKSTWTQTFPYTFDTKLIAETHEVLASLQPPATLKGLCVFMATLNAANRENVARSTQHVGEQTRMDLTSAGGPLALEIQLERLPGTRWSLPTLVQSLSSTIADARTAAAAATPSLVSIDTLGCSEKYFKIKHDAEPQIHALHQSAPGAQNPEGEACEETKNNAHTTIEEDYSHDAGYDSLMTSVVYLLQLAHVLPYHGLRWQNVSFGLSRTQPASINLGGKDEQLLHQKRLLFMRNHPSSWKKWEIMKIWSPVWVDVQMVDDTSSWIVARDEEDAQNIVTIYQMMKNPQFELLNYDQYRTMQRQGPSQQQQ